MRSCRLGAPSVFAVAVWVTSVLCLYSIPLFSQRVDPALAAIGEVKGFIIITDHAIYTTSGSPLLPYREKDYEAPAGTTIKDDFPKGGSGNFLVLLDTPNGAEVVHVDINNQTSYHAGYIGETGSETWEKVEGDAVYVLSTSNLYVCRDSLLQTWTVDSAGLNGALIYDFSLDTLQNVWAATNHGVYWQNKDSSAWHQVASVPVGTYQCILVDQFNRIFAAFYPNYNGRGVYLSTNGGGSWAQDSAGLTGIQIQKLKSDSAGNTYAFGGSGALLYRRPSNSSGWSEIGGPLRALSANPNFSSIINDIDGGSTLYAATAFGLFQSTDGGTSWLEDNTGIPAETISGFERSGNGKWFTSTSLGVFSKNPSDTSWTKSYPTNGYLGGLPLSADGAGNLYTLWGGLNNRATNVYVSTDNGTSWNPDTAGLTQLPASYWFVDELGGQHLATFQYGSSFHAMVFAKPPGGSWNVDTTGFQSFNYSSSSAIASDKHGYLYLSGSYYNVSTPVNAHVMRHPIAGGAWTPDTTGLGTNILFYTMMPDKNGNMIGSTRYKLFGRRNDAWTPIPLPSALSGPHIDAYSVDSSNALFAAFSISNVSRGVYFSTDTGATWTYAGLDSISVNQLVSYGDSTFACTNNGLYILRRQAAGTTGVKKVDMRPATFALFQNYPNPFNPTTTIQFSIGKLSIVDLKIYDLLGREVATLAHGEMNAGMHEVSFDASKLASGIYFYRLKAGSFAATRKLVLLK